MEEHHVKALTYILYAALCVLAAYGFSGATKWLQRHMLKGAYFDGVPIHRIRERRCFCGRCDAPYVDNLPNCDCGQAMYSFWHEPGWYFWDRAFKGRKGPYKRFSLVWRACMKYTDSPEFMRGK